MQNHLNQPYSACLIHYNELLEINTGLLKQLEGNSQSTLLQPSNPDVEAPASGYGSHGEGIQLDFEPTDMDIDFVAEPVAAPRGWQNMEFTYTVAKRIKAQIVNLPPPPTPQIRYVFPTLPCFSWKESLGYQQPSPQQHSCEFNLPQQCINETAMMSTNSA